MNFANTFGKQSKWLSDIPSQEFLTNELPPCQIVNSGVGDNPIKFCQASTVIDEDRFNHGCLAEYDAFPVVEFYVHAQPYDGPLGYIFSESDSNSFPVSLIYQRSYDFAYPLPPEPDENMLLDFLCQPPEARCERLGFFGNFSKTLPISGNNKWYAPAFRVVGVQNGDDYYDYNTTPVGSGYLFGRPSVPNYNPSIITSGSQPVSMMIQDIGEMIPSGGGYAFPHSPLRNPGFNDPYTEAEVWGGWAPAIMVNDSDSVPSYPGQEMNIQEYECTGTKLPGNNNYDYTCYDLDLITYPTGSYDWRFLYCFANRWRRYTIPSGSSVGTQWRSSEFVHYGPLYWNFNSVKDMPTGPLFSQNEIPYNDGLNFRDYISSGVYSRGIPTGTIFDVKIQAVVYSFRAGEEVFNNAKGFTLKVLGGPNGNGIRKIWDHTIYKIQARQEMPIPISPTFV